MKYTFPVLLAGAICSVSCVGQPAPKAIPPRTPREPIAPAPAPLAPDIEADVARQVKKAAEDVAKAKDQLVDIEAMNTWLVSPFSGRDESSRSLVLPRNLAASHDQSDTEEDLKVM